MTYRFNLIHEPWIPCVMSRDGSAAELSLRDTLVSAPDIREIADSSPLVMAALHRLLLAVLHRVYQGPKSYDEWGALQQSGAWDTGKLDAYFDDNGDRFDLFDPEWPFYQTRDVEFDYAKPVSIMVHGLTLGNYVTLFDHTTDTQPVVLTPAEAARSLVAFQAFALGGLISLRKGEPTATHKAADAAPLAKGVVSLVKGTNLFETLLLNLHGYDGRFGMPFDFEGDDQPAWERKTPTQAEDRRPVGYVDLLTWQSRRMRLKPETDVGGQVIVRSAVIMKGNQFPDGWHARDHETMLAFRDNPAARPGQDPFPVLTLRPDRALWRDSLALFQSLEARFVRPKMQSWLADLAAAGWIDHGARYALELHGMSIDRATVFLWRHERLPLSIQLLTDTDLFGEVARALGLAERVGQLFNRGFDDGHDANDKKISIPRPMQIFADTLAAPSDDVRANPDTVKGIVESLAPEQIYWSRLEIPFKQFLIDLPNLGGTRSLSTWGTAVQRTARAAFREATYSFGPSPHVMKATINAERRFNAGLYRILQEYGVEGRKEVEEEEHESIA